MAGKWLTKQIILMRGDMLFFFLRDPISFVGIDFDFSGYINTCHGRTKIDLSHASLQIRKF